MSSEPGRHPLPPPSTLVRAAQARLLDRLDASGEPDTPELELVDLELPPADADRYEFGEVVATGGFGLVRRAFDRRLGRVVAVKELRHSDPAAQRRFLFEATITARLQHPGIVPIHDIGRFPGGEPYYCMSLIDGRTLAHHLGAADSQRQRLALLPHLLAAADAVAHAHAHGVIHRDLKPANILIGEHGETVVIDWGLAKDLGAPGEPRFAWPRVEPGLDATLTDMGAVLGTLHYMPPEQARGQAVDRRSDVFALGAVLFHVLVGQPPRAGLERSAILARLTRPGLAETAALRLSSGPRELIAIAEKAMAPRPDDRYLDAAAFADDLRRYLAGRLVDAHRYHLWELLAGWLRRHRAAVAVATIAAAALLGASLLFLARLRDEHAQATAARGRAEASELQALRRADLAILAQARGALAEDLVEALSLTRAVDLRDPDNLRRARLTALAAQARGAPDRVLRGHPRRIEDLAPLSDGRLVSVDVGGEVRRWDPATGLGEVMVDLQAPHGRVIAAAVAPVWAAIAGDRAYVVRGDEAGENIAIAPLYQGSYNTHEYALSRHGETLAALGQRLTLDRQDAAAYTWDLLARPAFAQPLTIKHRRKTAISPDGATLATLDDDNRVVLISGATITPVPELRSVNHFSASGRYLIGGSATTPPTTVALALADRSQVSLGQGSVVSTTLDDRALVSEHDTATGPLREPRRLTLRSLTSGELLWTADLEVTKAVIHALWGRRGGFALPESGDRFALHLDDRWQLRSLQTGALVQTLATGPHPRGVFLADGGFAVAHDTELWLWAAPPPAGPDYYAASSASDGSHAIAYPWPEQALVLLRHADGHTRPLTCLAGVRPHELARAWPRLAVDGRGRVAVVDAAGGVCLEDAGTRRDLAVPSRATSVALAERGPGLAVGLLDGSVLGFSAPDAAPQRWQLDGPVAQVWVVGALATVIARTGRGTVVALQPGNPEPARLGAAAIDGERHDVRVVPHPVRSDAVAVLLGHEDAIVFHEAGRGVTLRRPVGFSLEPAAVYGPGGRQFAVALADRRLLVLTDLESAGREYTLPEDARAVAFVDEHELVAVGDSGSQIRLDLAIGEAVVVQRAWVRHPAAPTLVSVAADGVIRVDSVGSLASVRVDAVPRDPARFLAWLAPRTR